LDAIAEFVRQDPRGIEIGGVFPDRAEAPLDELELEK